MRTEEYIIILVGVTATDKEIQIAYSSNSPKNDVTVKISYSNGMTLKTFDQVQAAEKGVLLFPSAGLLPGTYTCTISEDGKVRDAKTVAVK